MDVFALSEILFVFIGDVVIIKQRRPAELNRVVDTEQFKASAVHAHQHPFMVIKFNGNGRLVGNDPVSFFTLKQLLFSFFSFGDVLVHPPVSFQVSLFVEDRHAIGKQADQLAIPVDIPVFKIPDRSLVLHDPGKYPRQPRCLAGWHEIEGGLADDIFTERAKKVKPLLRAVGIDPVLIHLPNPFGHAEGDIPQLFLILQQSILRIPPVGDVDDGNQALVPAC